MAAKKKAKGKPRKPRPLDTGGLTCKQRLFVSYYLGESNGNATDAARRAGFAHPNVQSARLLVNVSIRVAIDARLDEAAIPAKEVLARLSDMAAADMGDFVSVDKAGGFALDLKRAKLQGRLHLVKKLSHTKYGVAIELHDAQAALEKLGRHRGLFLDRHEIQFAKLSDEELLTQIKGSLGGGGPAGPDPGGEDG